TARLFAQENYRVILAARRAERLQNLADEIRAAGGQALPVPMDVGRLEDVRGLVSATQDRYGQIDVLFNNAGFGRLDFLEELDPVADIEAQLRVNVLGVVQTAQAVLPHMIARRSGHIINMSSVAGFIGTPTYSIYAASKFAVRGFSEALRREVGVYGIHVSGIYPGGTSTEFAGLARIRRKTGQTTPAFLRLEAGDVARAVMGLVRHPRRTLILPRPMLLGVWANALFPGLVDWLIERRFTRPERADQFVRQRRDR
ncbi:MAG TPA: SDR family NAD(P)-dependent oxidoreductase, partial [Anaerolineales bacterium]